MRVHDVRKKLNIGFRIVTASLLVVCSVAGAFPIHASATSADTTLTKSIAPKKKLTLKAARSLALQNSMDYENGEDSVASKQAAYESAVKAINLKEKSMRQFRWTPLLNFKFPTDPTFAEASEFQYKPVALTYEIKVAQHKLQDKIFEIDSTVKVENFIKGRYILNDNSLELYKNNQKSPKKYTVIEDKDNLEKLLSDNYCIKQLKKNID